MSVVVVCPKCHHRLGIPDDGKELCECAGCRHIFPVADAVECRCFSCHRDITYHHRAEDSEGHVICRKCQEQLNDPDDLNSIAEVGDGVPAVASTYPCAVCGSLKYENDLVFDGAHAVCSACRQKRLLKLAGIIGACLVGAIGLTVGVVLVSNRVSRPNTVETVQVAQTTNQSRNTVEERTEALADPARQLADIESESRNASPARLLELISRREQLVAKASPKKCAAIDQLKEEALLVEQSRRLVRETRYREAVEVIKSRLDRQKPPLSLSGQLVVAMVEAAGASVTLDGRWQLGGEQLTSYLSRVNSLGDPYRVRAQILQAWLVATDRREELLRLDARATVVERNHLLLPIDQSLSGISQDAKDSSRDVHAAIKFSLGLPNMVALRENEEWVNLLWRSGDVYVGGDSQAGTTENAKLPATHGRMDLRDRMGNRFRILGDLIMRYAIRDDGGREWQLVVPPRSGEASWCAASVGLLVFLPPGEDAPGDKPISKSIFDRRQLITPLSVAFATFQGRSPAVYQSQSVDPEQMLTLLGTEKVPLLRMNFSAVADAWNLTVRAKTPDAFGIKGNLVGRCIALEKDIIYESTDGLEPGKVVSAEGLWKSKYLVELVPLTIVREDPKPTVIEFFNDSGGNFLLAADGRAVYFSDDGVLRTETLGGGVVYRSGERSALPNDRLIQIRLKRLANSDLSPEEGQLKEKLKTIQNMIARCIGSASESSVQSLLVQALSARDSATPLPKRNGTSDIKDSELVQYINNMIDLRRYVREPYGEVRGRIVEMGKAGSPAPYGLRFYDSAGEEVQPFYDRDSLLKLESSYLGDFWKQSVDLVIPPPSLIVLTPQGIAMPGGATDPQEQPRYQQFLMGRAESAARERNWHLAATLYAELDVRVPQYRDFDPTKPRNRDEVDKLAKLMVEFARAGEQEMQARLTLADVLDRVDRKTAAVSLRYTVKAEWQLIGLPLIDRFVRYSEAYGYPVPDDLRNACNEISLALSRLPFETVAPAASLTAVRFDPAAAASAPNVELWMEKFYSQRPSREEYLKAKDWIIENKPRILFRSRTATDTAFLAWRPSGGALGAPITRTSLLKGTVEAWGDILYALETSPEGDYELPRRLLIQYAINERELAAKPTPTSREALVHAANANSALALAIGLEPYLKPELRIARFDRFVGPAIASETTEWIVPYMIAVGVAAGEAREAGIGILDLLLASVSDPERWQEYVTSRYYWYEYAGVTQDYLKSKSGGSN